jgi:hypothetical protein
VQFFAGVSFGPGGALALEERWSLWAYTAWLESFVAGAAFVVQMVQWWRRVDWDSGVQVGFNAASRPERCSG